MSRIVFFNLLCAFLFTTLSVQSAVAGSEFQIYRALASSSQMDEAVRILKAKIESTSDVETRTLAHFALGVLYYDQGNDQDSQKNMFEAINLGTRIDDFAHFYIGQSFRRMGNKKEAKREFLKVLDYKPVSQQYVETRFIMGEMALEDKDFREASHHFTYLEKKLRRSARYTASVINLVRSDLGAKNRMRVCKWMRKLYTQYPGDDLLKAWTVDLHKVEIDGQKPGCIASPNDLKTRIRNLQYAGLSDKARSEIEVLQKRSGDFAAYYTDVMLANFLVTDGHVDEAFKILVPYYKTHTNDYSYLMLMAKAASRAGEYQTASGAFYKAYQLTPNSRKGREALFQAAFLSYQNNDYDGAATKFDDFLKKFSSSGLSRDAKWYLAWIRYLKSDYDGAYERFSQMSSRGSRKTRMTYSQDRIDYWRAMSLMKAGKLTEAKSIFQNVSDDKLLGYYALAAQARLENIKEESGKRGLAGLQEPGKPALPGELVKVGAFRSMTDGEPLIPTEQPSMTDQETGEASIVKQVKSEEDEAESGIQLSEEDDESSDDEVASDESVPQGLVVADDGDNPQKTSFKDPRLTSRFKRANDLATLGFHDWAKYELWEIERRTRNRDYLKMLMSEYESNGAFNRSSNIAQEEFGGVRAKQGLDKAKYLWQFSYPKAYDRTVSNFSRSFRVPQELVWSIMRAESRYKPDVVSPVGAIGLMQLMPYTADKVAGILQISGFQPRQLVEPEMNIRLGTRYLGRLDHKLNHQIPLIAAAYNAGPHRVTAWIKSFGKLDMDEFIEHIPFFETRNYVKKVTHNYYVYSSLYQKDPKKTLSWLTGPVGVEFDGPIPTKETWEDIGG